MSILPAVRLTAAAVVGALAVLGTVVLLAVPADAHAVVTGTSPEEGSTVTEQPDIVVLEFSGPVGFAQVQVTGPDGESVEGGAPVEHGSTVELPLPPELEPGVYAVAFRVTADDGHPIAQTFTFAYEGAGEAGAEGERDSRVPEEAGGSQEARDGDRGVLVLVGVLVALLGFAAAAVFAARRDAAGETNADAPGPEAWDHLST